MDSQEKNNNLKINKYNIFDDILKKTFTFEFLRHSFVNIKTKVTQQSKKSYCYRFFDTSFS